MLTQGIIRAVCAIIDAFHFGIRSQQPDSSVADAANSSGSAVAVQEAATTAETDADSAADHADIQAALTRRVLPSMRGQLVQNGEVSHNSILLPWSSQTQGLGFRAVSNLQMC